MKTIISIAIVLAVAMCFGFAGHKIVQEAKRTKKYWQIYLYVAITIMIVLFFIYTTYGK